MNWINKLFGKKEEIGEESAIPAAVKRAGLEENAGGLEQEGLPEGIRFGRYSDNNKSLQKTNNWYLAEDRFREKNYTEAFAAFFDYLRDEDEDNVIFRPDGRKFTFALTQGSKKIYGECDGDMITARSPLAIMETPGTAIMRRLLELNYSLYYCHSSLDEGNTLYMVFSADVPSANPSKLYYGLRELATKTDRQDDLLLADFSALKPVDTDHIQPLSDRELGVKYKYFRKWIQDTLNIVAGLNQDAFSGAIAYLLLGLTYRIEFLITPESKLLLELEKINKLYWEKKDEISLVERNHMMMENIRRLLEISREEFSNDLYRAAATFSFAPPAKMDKVKEHIIGANKDAGWYIENKYPEIAMLINEYGVLYNQFVFSMPKVCIDLIAIYSAVLHPDFFGELGMKERLYDEETKQFNTEAIRGLINAATSGFQDKYKNMRWDHDRISYDNLYDFGVSFSEHMANLNLETKRI